MELFQLHNLDYWQLWTPFIGGVIIFIGLNIRIFRVEDDE